LKISKLKLLIFVDPAKQKFRPLDLGHHVFRHWMKNVRSRDYDSVVLSFPVGWCTCTILTVWSRAIPLFL